MSSDYYAQFPQPRADRLAAAFAAFVELADSGGPGTTRGLIAAAELATTVPSERLIEALRDSGITPESGTVGLYSAVLDRLGFVIEEK